MIIQSNSSAFKWCLSTSHTYTLTQDTNNLQE